MSVHSVPSSHPEGGVGGAVDAVAVLILLLAFENASDEPWPSDKTALTQPRNTSATIMAYSVVAIPESIFRKRNISRRSDFMMLHLEFPSNEV
jgi:hypothetical protein